jgi:hypothetical protein
MRNSFPGEALKNTRRVLSCHLRRSRRPAESTTRGQTKVLVLEEHLVGVCAFDTAGTLETVAELEGRKRRKQA